MRTAAFWLGPGMIALVVVLANLPSLLHIVATNPLGLQTQLDTLSQTGFLPGFPSIDPNDGVTTQALGHLAASTWLSGHVPLWNSFEGIGMPLGTNMEAAAWFPPVLLLAFSGGELYLHILLEVTAGLATFALARRLGISQTAAIAAGAAFALNGTFSWLGNAPVNPIPFLPLGLLGVECLKGPSSTERRWGWVALVAAVALSIYAGFPETAYIDGVLVGIWVLLRLPGQTPRELYRFVAGFGSAAVTGVLIAAPLLVPFAVYALHADLGAHAGSGFATAALPRSGLTMLALPYVFGPIFGLFGGDPTGTLGALWSNVGGYTTASVLVLAVVGFATTLRTGHRDWLVWGLAAWVLLSVSRTFGLPVLASIVNAWPLMSHVAFFRYSPPSWELCLIILAAYGIDRIQKGEVSPLGRWTAAGIVSAWLLVAGALAIRLVEKMHGYEGVAVYAAASLLWGAIVAATIGYRASRGPRTVSSLFWMRHGLASLVLIEAVGAFLIPQLSAPTRAPIDLAPVHFLSTHLGTGRFFTLGPLQPDYGSYFGFGEVDTADLPVPQIWATYIETHLAPNSNPITFTGLQTNSAGGPTPVAQFLSALPSYEAVGVRYVMAPTDSQASAKLAADRLPESFSDRVATIFALPHPKPLFSVTGPCREAEQTVSSTLVTCTGTGTLLRRELYMPGWLAHEGPNTLTVREAQGLFQSVTVHEGKGPVTFTYVPEGLNLGLWFGLVGLAFIVLRVGFWSRSVRLNRLQRRPCNGSRPP